MAESYPSNDPTVGGASGNTMQRKVRVGESEHERAADYQAEIEKLRTEVTKLAESVGGTVKRTVQPMTRELEATVARNPTVSVAIAAGVGLLLGLMMSRK